MFNAGILAVNYSKTCRSFIDFSVKKCYNFKVVLGSILVLQQEKGHPPAWQRFSKSFFDKYL